MVGYSPSWNLARILASTFSREMGLSEEHSSGSLPFLATSVIQASVNDVESLLSMSESENTSDNLGRSIEENALVLIYCYF